MRALFCGLIFVGLWTLSSAAQDANADTSTSICTLADGNEISVRYGNSSTQEDLRNGKAWQPGSAAMLLFTPTPLVVNHVDLAPGAYRLYVIPDKKIWTLVISKDVTPGSPYDPAHDLVREPMEIGELNTALKQPDIGFAHVAPKQCNLRVYYGKVGAWAEISQK